jgi:hypothetical protein
MECFLWWEGREGRGEGKEEGRVRKCSRSVWVDEDDVVEESGAMKKRRMKERMVVVVVVVV